MSGEVRPDVFSQARNYPIKDVIEWFTGEELVPCGTETFELESKECPFCGHQDCFRVKVADESGRCTGTCFSCGERFSDAAGFVAVYKDVGNFRAAKMVIEEAARHGL